MLLVFFLVKEFVGDDLDFEGMEFVCDCMVSVFEVSYCVMMFVLIGFDQCSMLKDILVFMFLLLGFKDNNVFVVMMVKMVIYIVGVDYVEFEGVGYFVNFECFDVFDEVFGCFLNFVMIKV